MPRDIPVGNGDMLVAFDCRYRIRDFYFPHVGQENHAGTGPFHFGIWVDGKLSWVQRRRVDALDLLRGGDAGHARAPAQRRDADRDGLRRRGGFPPQCLPEARHRAEPLAGGARGAAVLPPELQHPRQRRGRHGVLRPGDARDDPLQARPLLPLQLLRAGELRHQLLRDRREGPAGLRGHVPRRRGRRPQPQPDHAGQRGFHHRDRAEARRQRRGGRALLDRRRPRLRRRS